MLRQIFASALSLNVLLAPGAWADDASDALTPGEAQLKLVEGHARFLVNKPERPNATVVRREQVADGDRGRFPGAVVGLRRSRRTHHSLGHQNQFAGRLVER